MFSLTYPPEEVGTAPYAGGAAEHLAGIGARVRVVTGMPHYPEWRVWDGYRHRWRMQEYRNGVDVLRLRSYVPNKQSALRRACYDISFLVRAIGTVGGRRPDAVIGVIPALADGILGSVLSSHHDVPLGIIVQDLTGAAAQQSGIPGGTAVANGTRVVEQWVLRAASRVAVVSEGFMPYVESAGVERHLVRQVRNWSRMPEPKGPPGVVRAELGWQPHQFILLHAGNMGFKQGLEHVIRAASVAAGSHSPIHFAFMGDGNQRSRLEAEASGLRNVSFLAPRYGQDFADVLGAADVLLVHERPSVVDMSLPSKLTSYFVAGRPVIASVMQDGATAREIRRSGGGVIVPAGDPWALLDAAASLAIDPARQARLARDAASHAAANLSKNAALHELNEFVSDLLDGGRK